MNSKSKFQVILAGVFALVLTIGFGCGDGNSPQNYTGPGSKWDVTFDKGNFTINRRDSSSDPITLTVGGTVTDLSTGFKLLTVNSVSGTNGPSIGDTAFGIEVPGYAFFLKPMEANSDQLLAMVSAGACPTADMSANWVLVKKATANAADDNTKDFWGTFSYAVATGAASVPTKFNLEDGAAAANLGASALGTATCADGLMTIGNVEMFLTQNGGAIVNTDVSNSADSSFIFALTQKAITSTSNLDGSYAGVLFDENNASGSRVQAVSATCTSGTCTGTTVTNVETGATGTDSVTIALTGTPDAKANGLITGTISANGQTEKIACMADINANASGKTIIDCVGQSPADDAKLFNFILVSK